MNKAAFQFIIPRRAAACCDGAEVFNPGMEYHSVLLEDPVEENYIRRDYCHSCWEKLAKPFSSSWKSSVPLKKEASDLPKKRDARALYLLKEALASNERGSQEEAFMLSLYLARKRLIYLRKEITRENGHSATLYEVAENEEMLCVPKLPLSELQVDKIQVNLAKKLNQ